MQPLLDSRQLRAFAVLARTGNFTRAAQELGLSQSAVSHAMRSLEDEIGCRLLDRVGKKTTLTPAGEQLLFHTEKILREMGSARQGITQLGTWGQSRLRIGAGVSVCQHVLPAVIREFKESFPTCLLTVEPAEGVTALELLRSQRVDAVVGLQPGRDEPLEFRPLFDDELVFVMHPLHPWAQAGRVDRATIIKQSYLLYHRASSTYRMTQDYFRSEGIVLPASIEFGSMEAIKELVKAGLGVSVLAPWIARTELAQGSLAALPLGRRKLRRNWGILHWRERRLSLAEETFAGLCRSATEELRAGGGCL
jgi:DNA-binding transcriptional LysR family regulator